MKRILALAILMTVALPACTAPNSGSRALPATSTQGVHKHVRHLQKSTGSKERAPSDVLGGAPGFRFLLALFDAPLIGATAANSQFNAGILGVDVIDQNGDSWQLVGGDTAQVVNLLALQETSLNLGSGVLPAGSYPSMQLLLDPATTSVTYNGQSYPVQIVDPNHPWWDPSQTIEAVSIPLSVTGGAGDSITATLDFNVFQSANLSNGVVYLTPTVAGGLGQPTIGGTVANSSGAPVSNATVIATDANGVVANTALTAADGSFHIRGINPGGYTVSVMNTYTTAAGVTVTASGADAGASPSRYVVVGPNSQVNLGSLSD
jgi:carboxypeptidase family protein/uncharacterized protein DUF4382